MTAVAAIHSIDRIAFDFDVGTEVAARAMQDRISAFCRDRLPDVLASGLAAWDDGPHIILERIEIDVGTVSGRTGDREFAGRLAERIAQLFDAALRRALRDAGTAPEQASAIAAGKSAGEPVFADPGGDAAALPLRRAADFFDAGLPAPAGWDADAIMLAALTHDQAALARTIRRWGLRHASRARLAHRLSAPVLGKLVRALIGHDAEVVVAYAADLGAIQRRRPFVAESAARFGVVLWELVLTHLLADRGSHFNTKSFIAATLGRLAGRYRLAYADLLGKLTRCAATLDIAYSARYSLVATLMDLSREAEAVPAARTGANSLASIHDALLQTLAGFLDSGVLNGRHEVADVVATLLLENPGQLVSLICRSGAREAARIRLLSQLDRTAIEQLVYVLEPVEGAAIVAHIADIETAQRRQTIVAQSSRAFSGALWELAFSYLLTERGSIFNTRSFIKSMVRNMAMRYGQRYRDFLLGLLAYARPSVTRRAPLLPDILRLLADEAVLGVAPHAVSGTENAAMAGDGAAAPMPLDMLALWLRHGVLPARQSGTDDGAIDAAMDAAIAQTPHALAILLRASGPGAAARLASSLRQIRLHEVLAVLAPQKDDAIHDCIAVFLLAREKQALPGIDRPALRVMAWEIALDFLLAPLVQWDIAAFVRYVAGRFAHRAGLDMAQAGRFMALGLRTRSAEGGMAETALTRAIRAVDRATCLPPAAAREGSNDADARLMHFLAYGVAPPAMSDEEVKRWLAAVRDADLAAAMRRCDPRSALLQRLGATPDQSISMRAIDVTAGGEAIRVKAFMRAALAGGKHVGIDAGDAFSSRVYYCVLAYLLRRSGTVFSFEAMVDEVLTLLSAQYRKPYRLLLRRAAQASAAGGAVQAQLSALYARHLLAADSEKNRSDAARSSDPASRAPQQLALDFLITGKIPAPAQPAERTALLHFLDSDGWLIQPQSLLPSLRAAGTPHAIVARLLRHVRPAQLLGLLRAMTPAYCGLLESLLLAASRRVPSAILTPAQAARLLSAHWEQILLILLDPAVATWPAQRLLDAIGRGVAARIGVAYPDYFSALRAAVVQHTATQQRFAPLLDILDQQMEGNAAVRRDAESAFDAAPLTTVPAADAGGDPCVALDYFFRYGGLPASAGGGMGLAALIAAAHASNADAFGRIVLAAAGDNLMRARMLASLSDMQIQKLAALLLGDDFTIAAACLRLLTSSLAALLPAGSSRTASAIAAHNLLKQIACRPGPGFDRSAYIAAVARHGRRHHQIAEEDLIAQARARLSRTTQASASALRAALAQAAHALEQSELARQYPVPEAVRQALAATPDVAPGLAPPDLPAGQSFYVRNAGMVLLWPFLHPYFEALALIDGRKFVDAQKQQRAMRLLQYLVSGSMDAPEFDLLLNKILCGIAPGLPPDGCAPMTTEEIDLSEQLLYSVTQHWDKLKNTDIENLRSTFLMRDGSLAVDDDGIWTLSVERRPFDMLLTHLPWSLATIRLSWMENMLRVDWK